MPHRWATVHEWLKWKYDRGEVNAEELFALIANLDSDAIQFYFQSSMIEDGYFEEVTDDEDE